MAKRKKKRPIERLTGANLAVLRMKVDQLHVSTSMLDVCRHVYAAWIRKANRNYRRSKKTGRVKRGWQSNVSPALRRGIVLACIEQRRKNLKLYCDVVGGKVGSG